MVRIFPPIGLSAFWCPINTVTSKEAKSVQMLVNSDLTEIHQLHSPRNSAKRSVIFHKYHHFEDRNNGPKANPGPNCLL
uniref:Uncharacterized protein n=1 Tax=Solanum lycopersicum TaxID=4081 RepID=A0A3Q7FD56_SOLLC